MLRVQVALALPEGQDVVPLELPHGSTAAQAVEAAGLRLRHPQLEWASMRLGIWSRPCGEDAVLRDGDRVEVYRPLRADPKDQRRVRARLKPSTRSRSAP
ncbi:MAG TPA: RnfH family protein [Usitatibacter sp.]|nr:RnfH family protein [Usitatibacter sp.]